MINIVQKVDLLERYINLHKYIKKNSCHINKRIITKVLFCQGHKAYVKGPLCLEYTEYTETTLSETAFRSCLGTRGLEASGAGI